MGVSYSCSFIEDADTEAGLESIVVKSIRLGVDDAKTPVRSVSFGKKDLEPWILKSLGSGKMTVEGCVTFKGREPEKISPVKNSSCGKENDALIALMTATNKETPVRSPRSVTLVPTSPEHEAAIKLQKVYKSFRTRRRLADCAILVEQSWWKLLDFAELKHSSISFFDIEKHESAISRWSRARTRVAKLAKGLSKNDKAQKLAFQHWLEAIDPRHRYGHNLHFYYAKWLHSMSKEPFFYWLDIGEGKGVNLLEKCSRSKLHQQCIKYLGPMERKDYEVSMKDGKLVYKQNGEMLHTMGDGKWIFVLSTSGMLYVGQKKKGIFQHSSFLAGGVTTSAGRLVVENGILKAVWPHSGHYRPTKENFKQFLSFLEENNVDLANVITNSNDEDEDPILDNKYLEEEENDNATNEHGDEQDGPMLMVDSLANKQTADTHHDFNDEVKVAGVIPKELILKRINSMLGTKSFQLGRQLSCKWTTGAGPRIGCVRDYPCKLRFRALEHMNLSPRNGIPMMVSSAQVVLA